MNRIEKKYQTIENYKIAIPVGHISHIYIKEGDTVKAGDVIFDEEKSDIAYSHNIPFELEIDPSESASVMCRVNGEYISAGEIIAEKLSKGGISTSKVIAQESGILNLSKIKYGIAEILSAKQKRSFTAPFDCTINRIDMQDSIQLVSNALEIKMHIYKNIIDESKIIEPKYHLPKQTAPLVVLKDGNFVVTAQDINVSVSGKVVFTGRHLHKDVAEKLFSAGAIWLVTNSMNYDDYICSEGRISIIQGFGNFEVSPRLNQLQNEINGSYAVIDDVEERLLILKNLPDSFFTPISQKINDNKKYVKNIKIMDRVTSYDEGTYGENGTVVEIEGGGEYCVIKFDGKEKSSVVPTSVLKIAI